MQDTDERRGGWILTGVFVAGMALLMLKYCVGCL